MTSHPLGSRARVRLAHATLVQVEEGDDDELARIFRADQDVRSCGDWERVRTEDPARRQRVLELIAAGALTTANDNFHAAMVLQHGSELDDYWKAHELAKAAADLGHSRARWLSAAARDRWLMHQGRPQKYGTQYRAIDGRWTLYMADESTTDEERRAAGVPSIAEARARAEDLTRASPPPATGSH